jgi:serine/threonine protein kinase
VCNWCAACCALLATMLRQRGLLRVQMVRRLLRIARCYAAPVGTAACATGWCAACRAGRMPEPIAAFYFAQLLRAVQFMHDNGFCHRDIKPENCMVERHTSRLKLIDFGERP